MPEIYQKLQQTDMGQANGAFPDTTGMKQSDEEYLSLYIPQHGGSLSGVVNITGTEATINSEPAKKAIRMQRDYIQEGYFHENSINHGDEESTTLHWSGKIACNHIQDSTDLWGDYLEEQGQAMRNGAYTWGLPMNAGTKAALAWLPAMGFIADGFSGQAEKDAAVQLMEWWVGDSNRAVDNAKNLGFVPIASQQIQQEEFWRGAALKTLEQFEPAVIPAVPGANAITYEIPRKMHQRVLQQGMSVDKATNMAADEINRLLQENQ
jgi:hypothetical protein